MNALLVISGIIVLAMMLDGYRIGFIKSVFGLIKLIVGAAIAAATAYWVSTFAIPMFKYMIPVVFISVIAVVLGILSLLAHLLNIVDSVPVVKQINRIAGLASGLVCGIVCVWIMFVVICYFSDTSLGGMFYGMIFEDETLVFLYELNPLKTIIDKWNVIFA